MRVAIAGFSLEAVTFYPHPTTREIFEQGALRGDALIERLRETNSVGGGFIRVCEAEGIEPVGLVYAEGGAKGSATPDAFDAYLREIIEGVKALGSKLDGLLLHLHGALVTTDWRTDLDFVRALRAAVGPSLPIVAGLDLHGNLDVGLAQHLTALVGYHESPHIDMGETGERAARIMAGVLKRGMRPATIMKKTPVVLPSIFTATRQEPLASIMAEARRMEAEASGFLDISIFTGFAYADVPQLGFTVVAVTDGDGETAAAAAERLASRISERRQALYRLRDVVSVEEAMRRVRGRGSNKSRPLVLLEHADRGEDSTYLLRALKDIGAKRVAVPYLVDLEGARCAAAAGVGEIVQLSVGGHSSARAGGPVTLSGRVLFAAPKAYIGTGPMRRGRHIDLGLAALIDADGIVLSLISHGVSAIDLDPFIQFGLRIEDFDVIVLRSKTHYRAVYEPLAEEILIVDTPDWGPADLTTLPYQRVRPGVFPITAG